MNSSKLDVRRDLMLCSSRFDVDRETVSDQGRTGIVCFCATFLTKDIQKVQRMVFRASRGKVVTYSYNMEIDIPTSKQRKLNINARSVIFIAYPSSANMHFTMQKLVMVLRSYDHNIIDLPSNSIAFNQGLVEVTEKINDLKLV